MAEGIGQLAQSFPRAANSVCFQNLILGNCVTAARQTLTLFVGVRIPIPQPKNPTHTSWIFSFVPIGTTSFAWHTQHHFERSENIIAARGTNERGCDKSQMMWAIAQRCYACGVNDVALRANGTVAVCLVRWLIVDF